MPCAKRDMRAKTVAKEANSLPPDVPELQNDKIDDDGDKTMALGPAAAG